MDQSLVCRGSGFTPYFTETGVMKREMKTAGAMEAQEVFVIDFRNGICTRKYAQRQKHEEICAKEKQVDQGPTSS